MRTVASALLILCTWAAQAQNSPDKPLRWIVPFPAGGPADILSRLVAERVSENVGQRILVDNRVGASGIIGTELAVKGPRHGYPIVGGIPSTTPINQFLNNMSYDPVKDLARLSLLIGGTSC